MIFLSRSITISIVFLLQFTAGDYCATLHSDLLRRQLESWSEDGPFLEDTAKEKHVPYVTVTENKNPDSNGFGTVVVGNGNEEGGVYHPMTASDDPDTVHFVTHMYVVDQHDTIFAMKAMDPLESVPSTMVFEIPMGVTSITAYEFCNKHGLWQGPTITLNNTSQVSSRNNPLSCNMHPDIVNIDAYGSFHADFLRRQYLPPFSESNPYTEDGKHAPYITLNGANNGTVVVGVEGNMHVMNAGDDENEPHWITEIYVVDQDGNIITYDSLDPSNVDIATMNFDVPESATELTAYEWCNIHGLWQGPTVQVQVQNVKEEKEGDDVVEDANKESEKGDEEVEEADEEVEEADEESETSSSRDMKSNALWMSTMLLSIFTMWAVLS